MPHPELIITIKGIGDAVRHEYEATLTRADNKAEICINTFVFDPDLLIDMEPQWMLDKAVPRHIDDAVRGDKSAQEWNEEQTHKLAGYGQRLYGFLFGDGKDLQSFLKYNDAYAQSAHLTLALHCNAAVLWRLPWEYIHDGKDFLGPARQISTEPPALRIGRAGPRSHHTAAAPAGHHLFARQTQAELNTEKEITRHPGSAGRGRTDRANPHRLSGRRHARRHRRGAQKLQAPRDALHRPRRLP